MNIVCEIALWWTTWFLCGIPKNVLTLNNEFQEPMTLPLQRRIRGLSYPEDSEMGLFFALAVPLDDPVSTKAISVAFFFEANYQLTNSENESNNAAKSRGERSTSPRRRLIDRRTIYSMLESKFESLGYPGRGCLLRSICETSRRRLHSENGLVGDLLRILFTPSSSIDEDLSDEFRNAENRSAKPDDCRTTYSLCPFDIYDYITTR